MKQNKLDAENSPELERYLAMCERAWNRMIETNAWPWEDEPDFDEC